VSIEEKYGNLDILSLLIKFTRKLCKNITQSRHTPYILEFFTKNYTPYIKSICERTVHHWHIARLYLFTSDMENNNSYVIVGEYFKSSYLVATHTLLVSVCPAGIAVTIHIFLLIMGTFIQN
jgi:hypothetical protein